MKSNSENGQDSKQLKALTLGALGVVFGDIGTSPLYALKETLHVPGIGLTQANLLGLLSIIFWSVMISVSGKYVLTMLQADNKGEGGIMALMALTLRHSPSGARKTWLLTLGIFGAALFYGDSVITPAISVLSAVEGLELATPIFKPFVIPLAVGILIALFMIQKNGTSKVGAFFGPVMLTWFSVLALLGIYRILEHPAILQAISPHFALQFCLEHRFVAFVAFGSIVLAMTGGEALFADMGHFGKKPIRLAWFRIVFPALMLCYFGQGALLLQNPEAIESPFYHLAPSWMLYPLIALATAATVIASQAVISGAYSLTRQAIQLGYWPRMRILHTSEGEEGQVYIPSVNFLLCAAVLAVVFMFKSSGAIASAYGIAVTATMAIDTLLAYEISRKMWNWKRWQSLLLFGSFLMLDMVFFGANTLKIPTGGWFPLILGLLLFLVMLTWFQGRHYMLKAQQKASMPMNSFLKSVPFMKDSRVAGTAVFLTGGFEWVPHALMHNLYHNKVLHQQVLLVQIITRDEPHVPRKERLLVKDLGEGFFGVQVNYGFMDQPNLVASLRYLGEQGVNFRLMEASFFVTHQTVLPVSEKFFNRLRMMLFSYMMRNARSPSLFFRLPPNRIIEVGSQIEV